MNIRLAREHDIEIVECFFKDHLHPDNQAVYSGEFLCPSGVRAAIKRRQVIVAEDGELIVAALRFYLRKRDKTASLYQCAIKEGFRRRGLLRMMLQLIGETKVISLCPQDIPFNDYYRKTGWTLLKSDATFNYWEFLPRG